MISVYKQEVLDGVAEQVKATASIKYEAKAQTWGWDEIQPLNLDLKDVVPESAKASVDDWDIYPFASILVSVGWNDNDDVFDAGEAWLAKNSPVNKQLNFMHNEKAIIGHMTKAMVTDIDGNIIQDQEIIPEFYDIVVANVLYRRWSDEELQKRADKIIAGIPKGEWFVSMECLFRGFDYALISPDGEHSWIRRDATTAHMTRYLRAYGGDGYYQDYKIGRMIRHLTFSGNAVVDNPANPRSIIFHKTDPFKGTANKVKLPKQEKNMADTNDVLVAQLKEDLAKANARYEKLEEKFSTQVAEAQKAEQERLHKTVAGLEVDIENLQKKLDETKASLEAKEEAFDALTKEHKETLAAFEDVKKKLDKTEKEKAKSHRISQLLEVQVPLTKAESLVEKFDNFTDEQFAEIVEVQAMVYKKDKASDDKDMDDKEKKMKKEAKAKEEAEAKAAADNVDNAKVEDDTFSPDNLEDTQAELTKAMCDLFDNIRNERNN